MLWSRCLCYDPAQRMTPIQALQHRFIAPLFPFGLLMPSPPDANAKARIPVPSMTGEGSCVSASTNANLSRDQWNQMPSGGAACAATATMVKCALPALKSPTAQTLVNLAEPDELYMTQRPTGAAKSNGDAISITSQPRRKLLNGCPVSSVRPGKSNTAVVTSDSLENTIARNEAPSSERRQVGKVLGKRARGLSQVQNHVAERLDDRNSVSKEVATVPTYGAHCGDTLMWGDHDEAPGGIKREPNPASAQGNPVVVKTSRQRESTDLPARSKRQRSKPLQFWTAAGATAATARTKASVQDLRAVSDLHQVTPLAERSATRKQPSERYGNGKDSDSDEYDLSNVKNEEEDDDHEEDDEDDEDRLSVCNRQHKGHKRRQLN